MNLQPFLCLAGNEIGNSNRTLAYVRNACLPVSMWFFDDCTCSLLDDEYPYSDPETDGAPWYVADRPESGEFLGALLDRMTLSPVAARTITAVNGGGAVVGPLDLKARTLEATGWMFASTCEGMQWGQRWLADVLQGSCGGCADDTAEILPSCPEDSEYDPDRFFRTLYKVGMTDGPTFASGEDACYLQEVSFTLVAGSPYLFAPEVTCLEEEAVDIGYPVCCLAETLEWHGDGVLRITLTADGGPVTNVGVTVTPTFDGQCPTGPQNPCASYTVPSMVFGESIIFDGPNERVTRYDPTSKTDKSGLGSIDYEGVFHMPDIAPCSEVCVCITHDGPSTGDLVATVDMLGREV